MYAKALDKSLLNTFRRTNNFENTAKPLNNGHLFCRAFVATIEGWAHLISFI